jgi:pyridoxamine 5'-phosphate oxidase
MGLDPMDAFRDVFARASASAPPSADHTAAALATCDADGRPAVRMVLVRRVDADGFLFFTNYESRKARELDARPLAALCFHWFWLEEQVRVEGAVSRATAGESDEYFATRPRGSQIGAWASRQSHPMPHRAELEDRYVRYEQRFGTAAIPRPAFWGGYRITPERIEFWRAGTYRLHDRLLFTRTREGWGAEGLYP